MPQCASETVQVAIRFDWVIVIIATDDGDDRDLKSGQIEHPIAATSHTFQRTMSSKIIVWRGFCAITTSVKNNSLYVQDFSPSHGRKFYRGRNKGG
jgi:hypothetical protein